MAKEKSSPKRPAAHQSWMSSLTPFSRDLLCVGLLYLLTLLVFRGIIFDNAAFGAEGDTAAALSYGHAGEMIKQTEKVDVLWMPYFFSGMPTFGNVAYIPHDINYIQTVVTRTINVLYLSGAWTWMVVFYLLAGVFMFMLARTWKFGHVASLLAAITFMLSPYAIGLAGEGHGSKLMALSYLPLVVLLTHLVFERRSMLYLGLFSAGVGTMLLTNHMQIAYYVFIVVGLYTVYQIVLDFKEHKRLIPIKVLLLAGALFVGACISAYIYLSVNEYAQFSMRGGGTAGSTGGLMYDYATNWSWSLFDAISLLIPGFYGIAGAGQPYLYWGHVEPWTTAYVYVGLMPIIFAVLALIYRRTPLTIFMTLTTVFVVLVSLGRNFPVLFDAMFAVLPFFNKFRTPSMILHLLPFLMGILLAVGYTAVEELSQKTKGTERLARISLLLSGITAGLFVIGFLLKTPLQEFFSSFLFLKENELAQLRQQYGAQAGQAVEYFKQQRFDIFWKDSVKFLILACGSMGAIGLLLRRTISPAVFGVVILALATIDLGIMDDRLISPHPRSAAENVYRPNATIAFLQQQPGQFRVLPLPVYGSEWNDNTFAYHQIQSLGGYSPAKLKIYQTMMDSVLMRGPDPSFPLNMNAVNMLNAEFLVVPGRLPEDHFKVVNMDQAQKLLTYRNLDALPRAWFVDTVIVAGSDHEVFSLLDSREFNTKTMAVIQTSGQLPLTERADSASARVTEYQSRRIVIDTHTPKRSLLVLSEIYYPAGWKAAVDGQEIEIYRTNSILRSVAVPAGHHEVTFTFDPPLYHLGYVISNAGWAVTGICIVVGLFIDPGIRSWFARRRKKKEHSPVLQSAKD